jgi:hypothetical protein
MEGRKEKGRMRIFGCIREELNELQEDELKIAITAIQPADELGHVEEVR